MSVSISNKTIAVKSSPSAGKVRQAVKIRQIYCSPDREDDRFETLGNGVKVAQSLNRFVKIFPKITTKKVCVSNSMNFSNSHENSEIHSYVEMESECKKIENVLKRKLKKENDMIKKLAIVLSTFEKLSKMSRNFYIFHSVLHEFWSQMRTFLIFSDDKNSLIKDLETKIHELTESNQNLESQVQKLSAESRSIHESLTKLKEEEKHLKSTTKKQAILLNKLKDAGYPVEKYYETVSISTTKSKSMNKLPIKLIKENLRPKSISYVGTQAVPKLKFSHLDGNEGYQEEFMAKFNEFSESWRKQIVKDHTYTNS